MLNKKNHYFITHWQLSSTN